MAHKGALWIQITTRGKAAHGSMPEEGLNAVVHMHYLLGQLLKEFRFAAEPDPVLGSPTLSANRMDGGVKVNVVPDECRLQIDIRTVPCQGHAEILEGIRRQLNAVREEVPTLDYELEILQERTPVSTSPDETLARIAEGLREEAYNSPSSRSAAPYFTDASIFVETLPDLPIVIYGPGDDRLAHQPNEWVGAEAFGRSIDFYERLVIAYFG